MGTDVYCGLDPSQGDPKWGNPFVVSDENDREEVMELHAHWLKTQPQLMHALPELRGANLICPDVDDPVHLETLKLWANGHPDYTRILIAGSRSYCNRSEFDHFVDEHLATITNTPIIISGMAGGVDTMAFDYGHAHGIEVLPIKALWDDLGRRAGYIRNAVMRDLADTGLIFWDRKSPGTKNMISQLKRHKIPCCVIIVVPGA